MPTRVPWVVWLSLALCAGLSLYSLSFRYRAESLNQAVSLFAESDQVETLAASQNTAVDVAIGKLKSQGMTGIVATEETVGELIGEGLMELVSRGDDVILKGDAGALARAARGLGIRFSPSAASISVQPQGAQLTVSGLSPNLVRQTPAGIDPGVALAAKQHRLELLVRHGNPPGATPRYIRETLEWSHELGARYFLPNGDQVLGRRVLLKELGEQLDRLGMYYVSPEFAKIGGDANMVAMEPARVVRLHAAQALEIDKLTQGGYIERYAKAATERNIRLLLLRPLDYAAEKPLDQFGELVASLSKQLSKERLTVRTAHPFQDSSVPKWLFVAIGLALAPLGVFAVSRLTQRRGAQVAAAVLLTLLGLACWVDAGRGYAALVGSMLLPIVAIMIQPNLPSRSVLLQFLAISAISLVGGLVVAGLLNELKYFVRADQFAGVKIAHFLPIALIGLYAFWRLTDAQDALTKPITWMQAVLGILILAVLAFMASRTGNDGPAGVSSLEMQFRSLLERFLVVRPRTKEFLIGHPAMIIGLGMLISIQAKESLRSRLGGWTALVLLVGAIGQTSMVNTMCHLHTPLAIGLTRIGVGLVLGAVIGGIGWALLRKRLVGDTV
jgi:hypothetical protein